MARTIKDIKAIGNELAVTKVDGEYRIAYKISVIQMWRNCGYCEAREQSEASAYYTNDADDAYDTARFMHNTYVRAGHLAMNMGAVSLTDPTRVDSHSIIL